MKALLDLDISLTEHHEPGRANMRKLLRVLHLPSTVGGNPQGISRSLCKLGVDSQTWTISQNYFCYPADKVLTKENDGLVYREIKKILALRYVFIFDIVFFNFGSGLFKPFVASSPEKYRGFKKIIFQLYTLYSGAMARIELGLLSLLKKPIFIQYQGDDARQGAFSKANFKITFAHHVDDNYYSEASDKAKRASISFYAARAAKIYALNPDLLNVLPSSAEFLPYSHINLKDWPPFYNQLEDRPLRIGHAPSCRAVKGTDLILQAMEYLKQVGYKFDLVLVEGLSNVEAKEVYKTFDILIDQLFAGWYGGLAVEAMALGKPVIAYIRQDDLRFIPEQMKNDLPIIQAEPDTICDVLEDILKMSRADLLEKAHQSRAYVEKWHDPIMIAQRIKTDMENALENIA